MIRPQAGPLERTNGPSLYGAQGHGHVRRVWSGILCRINNGTGTIPSCHVEPKTQNSFVFCRCRGLEDFAQPISLNSSMPVHNWIMQRSRIFRLPHCGRVGSGKMGRWVNLQIKAPWLLQWVCWRGASGGRHRTSV